MMRVLTTLLRALDLRLFPLMLAAHDIASLRGEVDQLQTLLA